MGYFCANFSLPRPICSQVRPDNNNNLAQLAKFDQTRSMFGQTRRLTNMPYIIIALMIGDKINKKTTKNAVVGQ